MAIRILSPAEYVLWKASREQDKSLKAKRRQFKAGKMSRKAYQRAYYLAHKERMTAQNAAAKAIRANDDKSPL